MMTDKNVNQDLWDLAGRFLRDARKGFMEARRWAKQGNRDVANTYWFPANSLRTAARRMLIYLRRDLRPSL